MYDVHLGASGKVGIGINTSGARVEAQRLRA